MITFWFESFFKYVGLEAATAVDSVLIFQDMFGALCLAEMLIINVASLIGWAEIAYMDDNLVSNILGITNAIFVSMLIAIRIWYGELKIHEDFQKFAGIPVETKTKTTDLVFFWYDIKIQQLGLIFKKS